MPDLNAAQRTAVQHAEGPLLVVAGAGSGKTTVITERIRHLICCGVDPGSILALTFSRKAAREMEDRVRMALPDIEPVLNVSTFHAFCYQLLRCRHFDRRLLDGIDLWIFLRQRIEKLALEHYQRLPDPGHFLHDLGNIFSRCQDELVEPEDFEAFIRTRERELAGQEPAEEASAGARREELQRLKEVAGAFRQTQKLLQEANCVSLGSLINETLRLFDHEPDLLAEQQQRFRYVLVDEFQDTNRAQIQLLSRLVVPPHNVTAVGDDDQAIYRFRGASYGSFQLFGELYPGHRTVFLFENYRSTKRILRVAEAVIAQNGAARYAEKKRLVTPNEEGSKVCLAEFSDFPTEARWVAEEVERLRRRGRPLGEMAILYRSHHYRDLLVEELRRRNIPFSIRGLSVLSATILRDLLAYLQVMVRPHANVSLIRLLLMPRWRLPEELARELRLRAGRNRRSIFAEIMEEEKTLFKGDLEKTGWPQLKALLGEFSARAREQTVTVLAESLLERLGLQLLPDHPDHRYLKTFMEFLKDWEEKSQTRKLAEFLEYLEYFRQAGGRIDAPEPENPSQALQLMTVHMAKGLEFPVVFVLGVAPMRFPHRFEKPRIEFPPELIRGPVPSGDFHLQEETRLFYVALTRAQRQLYICSTKRAKRKPSVFVQTLVANGRVAGFDLEPIEVSSEPRPAGINPGGTSSATPSRPDLIGEARNSPCFYPDIAGWAGSRLPQPLPEKLVLSASAVEIYQSCPLRFKLGQYLKVPTGPHPALTFGNIMHVCVKRYFELREKGVPLWEQMERIYASEWRRAGFEDRYQEQAYRKAGREQLRRFWERHRHREVKPLSVEHRFRLDLPGLVLEGRIDQINSLGENRVELVDYKTGSDKSQKDADRSLQLSLYALAARRELQFDPQRLTFYNLSSNEPVSAARTEKDLEKALDTLYEVAEKIRREEFAPRPGFRCKNCDYFSLCPAHEQNP